MTPKEDEVFLGSKDKVFKVKNGVISEHKVGNTGSLFHVCIDKSKQ